MAVITCIEDLRRLHRRRAPRMFYEYVDGGSWSEQTYRENEAAFQRLRLRQRVAVDIEHRSIAGTLLGEPVTMPVALAPVGLTGMQRAGGEILAARAAQRFGVPFTLSTMSICSIEDLADALDAPFWFQLYIMRDRDYIARLIARAAAARCSALVLTLDLAILGRRHKDARNGLSVPPRPTLGNLLDLARRPAWSFDMLRSPYRTFRNIVGHVEGVDDLRRLSRWSDQQLDPSVDWQDVDWVRDRWQGRFVLKGIMDVEDARRAVAHGADAIVVSNHGGRQLDGAPATIDALPAILEAVGERVEVWVDGGIRSGQDVFKALALGARGVMIGRAFVYGLGALGEAGVTRALEIIASELDLTMAFCGHTDLSALDGSVLGAGGAVP